MNKIFALLLLIILFSCTDQTVMERYDAVRNQVKWSLKDIPDLMSFS
jgi:hypothetical protein